MKPIELYTTPEGDVTLREMGEAERQLKETDTEFIQKMLSTLNDFYPQAHEALMQIYSKSALNKSYRDYLAVRRFIKCNFGVYDNAVDIDQNFNFKFEFVSCPLRGECKWDGVLCQPQFNNQLSTRQAEVMKLCYRGMKDEQIADMLSMSLNTLLNHKKAAYRKLGIHSMSEFIRYASEHHLYD